MTESLLVKPQRLALPRGVKLVTIAPERVALSDDLSRNGMLLAFDEMWAHHSAYCDRFLEKSERPERTYDTIIRDEDGNYGEPATMIVAIPRHGPDVVGVGTVDHNGYINNLATDKAWRKHGIGSSILTALENTASANGLVETRLASTEPAREFYERRGYVISEEGGRLPGVKSLLAVR